MFCYRIFPLVPDPLGYAASDRHPRLPDGHRRRAPGRHQP